MNEAEVYKILARPPHHRAFVRLQHVTRVQVQLIEPDNLKKLDHDAGLLSTETDVSTKLDLLSHATRDDLHSARFIAPSITDLIKSRLASHLGNVPPRMTNQTLQVIR